MTTPPSARRVDCLEEILTTYHRYGHAHYGENVSELEHALQCATFALRAGEPAVLIAACLLHDYGHLRHGLGEDCANRGIDAGHESIGAAALAPHFQSALVAGVALHVEAKRYLCFAEPEYLARLSPASVQSLRLQGGPHDADAARAFLAHPHSALALRVSRYDELGKVTGMTTPSLDAFRDVLLAALRPERDATAAQS